MKYHTAEKAGCLVHIDNVDPDDRKGFTCIECQDAMIPKIGKVNEHHFAHKGNTKCSGESYLHKLAKRLFIESYQKCLVENRPFYLEYYSHETCISCEKVAPLNTTCKFDNNIEKFDLTQPFDSIEEEVTFGGFRADILLSSSARKEKIFIEIAVTHETEQAKISSNIRIIEYHLESQADLELFALSRIPVNESRIKRFNFQRLRKNKRLYEPHSCKMGFDCFTVSHDGTARISYKQCREIIQEQIDGENIYFKLIERDPYTDEIKGESYVLELEEALSKSIRVKNCFLCRYHAKNWESWRDTSAPVFCKFLKQDIDNSNFAAQCKYFRYQKS